MTIFDKVLDWFSDLYQRDAKHRIAHFIDDGGGALKANEHYFRLWLDEMFLTDERRWFAEWHPAVHSAVTFEFGNQTQVVTRIAGAASLKDVDAGHLNRVSSTAMKLTEVMPFKGGTIRINSALLAMKGKDSVKQLVDVLSDFSSKLAVPQLSTALDIARPLAQGVSALVGVTDGEMMLGLDTTLSSGPSLRSGSYAVVFADENDVPKDQLSVVEKQLYFEGKHMIGRNYMLLRIESLPERDDWDSLDAIKQPYDQAIDMLTSSDLDGDKQVDAAQKILRKAIGAALKSPDLTEVDRRRVIDIIKQRYKDAKAMVGAGAFIRDTDRSLKALLREAMSPSEAAAMGPITELEAFEGLH
ncbi:MAG: hypothetical protein JOY64_02150 [Alphaproteobacteria bacterium]|nr:hypothetical protein [Alphaproteobacteria bacterium]MBV8406404.1 hypothetical protein [Alphaproteobacteria bacterium]